MAFAKNVKPFNDEIKFQVGERVKVVIPNIKSEDIGCDTGIIVKIYVKFMHTPEMRKIRCSLRMDGEYIKEPLWQKIGEIIGVDISCLRKIS